MEWASIGPLSASEAYPGQVEIIDLRTLVPLDEELIVETVKRHSRCLIVTEEKLENSFAMALAGKIQRLCFEYLDAPIEVIGSQNMPAIPLNSALEAEMIPNAEKVKAKMDALFAY